MRRWKIAFLAGLGYAERDAAEVIASLGGLGYEGLEWTIDRMNSLETG